MTQTTTVFAPCMGCDGQFVWTIPYTGGVAQGMLRNMPASVLIQMDQMTAECDTCRLGGTFKLELPYKVDWYFR